MAIKNKEIINCKNVSKQFGYFFALKDISFKVIANTIFGIAGANGAGKTTLIKILSGLMNPSSGKVYIQGNNYTENPFLIKEMIGINTEESFLYEELTINENLEFYDNLHYNFNKSQIRNKVENYAELFEIHDWLDEPIRNLSHGMKQKVEIIRVLMHEPSILFLDEPFSGLDFKATKLLINLLQNLKKGKNVTIILTTHKIDVLSKIYDDLIILKKGKINKFITKETYEEFEIESYF
ncbi:MAG: ABC transporter ATP-binding protein [Candidatus Heimdallarchaeota archaeon]